MASALGGVPRERIHLVLMLVLTFTTGINDAVGYLGLDKVFTGNMTGNVVILGMAISGVDGLPVLGPALALAGFLLGAAIGGRALKKAAAPWTSATTGMLVFVALAMFGSATVLWVAGEDLRHSTMVMVTTTCALSLGVQAATARHIAVRDVTTVVVTSTITGLAADSWLGNGRGGGFLRRATAVVLMGLGATVGALLLYIDGAWGLALAGTLITLVAIAGETHRRHENPNGVG